MKQTGELVIINNHTPKFLQLGKYFYPFIGGIETVNKNLTELLVSKGITCDVLCSNSTNSYSEETFNNYKVFRTPCLWNYYSLSFSPAMITKLRQIWTQYDAIIVHMPDPMANLALYLARPKNKIILYWHSDIVSQKKLVKLYRPLLDWLVRRADHILGATPAHIEHSEYKEQFFSKSAILPYFTKIADNGLDEQENRQLLTLKERYRDRKILLYTGRMVRYKNLDMLIKVASLLDDRYILIIAGEGERLAHLKVLAAELGLHEDKIIFLNSLSNSELRIYYSLCDLFVFPSNKKNEMFGMSMLEVISFGKPVVSCKVEGSGMDYVNINNITGIQVASDSPHDFADAVKQILNDNELYNTMSVNCLKHVEQNFASDVAVEMLTQLITTKA